jgi:hypothetical protein
LRWSSGVVVLLKLLLGLLAEVAAVDQEQHAARPAELDQAVDLGDRGERLARAGRHLEQRARLVEAERLLEVADGDELVRVELAALDRGHRPQAGAQR